MLSLTAPDVKFWRRPWLTINMVPHSVNWMEYKENGLFWLTSKHVNKHYVYFKTKSVENLIIYIYIYICRI